MAEERLQKILSRAGVTSRRKAETLIVEGRVTVNGAAVTELGSKADLDRDHIKVDGKLLRAPRRLLYIALNKPVNCVTTVSDPEGRVTAPAGLKIVRKAVNPWYEVKLVEGRKNQIRVMFKHFGRLVEKLKRVRIGFLELGPIKPGQFRHLSLKEIERFQKLIKRSA